MSVKIQGRRGKYVPKDTDEVCCEVHGVVTTWGELDSVQQLAVETGLDTVAGLDCLLIPRNLNHDR